MSERLTLEASLTVADTSSSCGGCDCDPVLVRQAYETVGLDGSVQAGSILLATDSPESIAFGDLTNAHVIWLKVTGGKVRARLTSADGSQQAIPVDNLLVLVSRTVPVTAIDLTRVAATADTPRVTFAIGQKI